MCLAVALRKESVDRNGPAGAYPLRRPGSLSARRAWIEMTSVREVFANFESLSARRAWIEIIVGVLATLVTASLSARRAWIEMTRMVF